MGLINFQLKETPLSGGFNREASGNLNCFGTIAVIKLLNNPRLDIQGPPTVKVVSFPQCVGGRTRSQSAAVNDGKVMRTYTWFVGRGKKFSS